MLVTPGNFGLSIIEGRVGSFVNIGQAIIRDSSEWTHAFVVLDDKYVMEAMPGGARIAPLSDYLDRRVLFSNIPLTDENRRAIVNVARALEGTPYSFIDYFSLALHHYGIDIPHLRKYIKNKGHMICSQLVDFTYQAAGIHLFEDGRWSQDVTPGALSRVLYNNNWDMLYDPKGI